MSGIDSKLREISQINDLQQRNQWMNRLHPLVKFALTIIYIAFVVSCDKYDLSRMIVFAIYPFVLFNIADLKLKDALYRMRLVMPLVLAVGIFNPLLDRVVIGRIGAIAVTSGMVSMISLMLKGIYSVLIAYVLIATTTIEEICYAMRLIHIPKMIVTVILLIYRYIYILGDEASRIMTAYKLRAPSQKGINIKAWGPLVGQWLIRSMDRATMVYESMTLRGFNGDYVYEKKVKSKAADYIYLMVWLLVFIVVRFTDIVNIIGGLFV